MVFVATMVLVFWFSGLPVLGFLGNPVATLPVFAQQFNEIEQGSPKH